MHLVVAGPIFHLRFDFALNRAELAGGLLRRLGDGLGVGFRFAARGLRALFPPLREPPAVLPGDVFERSLDALEQLA